MSWDDLLNLNLDDIFSVAPTSKPDPEPEVALEVGEAKLIVAKTVVENFTELSVCQMSNLSEVTEAIDLLINSSITESHKTVLAKLRDQLPFLVSNVKSFIEIEEENAKKLEARKVALEGLAKLKAKFKMAKAKNLEIGKRALTA